MNNIKAAHDVGTLLAAYNAGMLYQNHRTACAVSHLVAKGLGHTVKRDELRQYELVQWYNVDGEEVNVRSSWTLAFCTGRDRQLIDNAAYDNIYAVQEEVCVTGYSLAQLASIEFAFESTRTDWHSTPEMLDAGLVGAAKAICKANNTPFRNLAPKVYAAIRARAKQAQ